jgi:hypothetical protein
MAETQDAPRGLCPVHEVPFVWKEGLRKDRTHYGFWACPMKVEGEFCRERPRAGGDVPPGNGNGAATTNSESGGLKENPFQPARAIRSVMKVCLFGPSGAGKTDLALRAFPRPVYLIDLEGGDDAFTGRPEFQFDRVVTRSFARVMEVLTWLRDNPGHCETLVLDPLTALSDVLRAQFAKRADRRAVRKGGEIDDADMDRRDWAKVGMHWKQMFYLLTEIRCHVVGICRDAILYQRKKGGGDQELEAIGFKPAAEKDVEYWFDVVARLTHEPGQPRELDIYKDRWGLHETHEVIEWPTFDNVFAPILTRAQSGEEAAAGSGDDVDDADRHFLEDRERRQAEDAGTIARQKEEIEQLYQRAFLREGAKGKLVAHEDKERRGFVPWLLRFYNVRRLADVPPAEYPKIISVLKSVAPGSLFDYRAPEHEERPEPDQPEQPAQDAPEDAERTLSDEQRTEAIAWARDALRTLGKAEGLTLEQWAQQCRPKVRLPFPVRMEGLADKPLQRFTLYLRSELTNRQVESEREHAQEPATAVAE